MSVYTDKKKITIAVALSGGVDSAVAAALLKKAGYKVVAFFMKNWGETAGLKKSECPWLQDRQDAMRVAAKLDIPFHTLDFEEEYKNQVLDYFFKEYEAGRTPNPDVMCNATIKFGVFLDKAMELGADYIATGHYAKIQSLSRSPFTPSLDRLGTGPRVAEDDKKDPTRAVFQAPCAPHPNPLPMGEGIFKSPLLSEEGEGGGARGLYKLLKSKDQNKDQTYFLYRLTQSQLAHAIFPIGDYAKPQVRQMAKKFGLPNHNKGDSQGVCFIGHIDLRKFLSQKIKENPGEIVTTAGKKVGEHQGLFWYTVGQRHGIGIGGIGPLYVVEKDLANNRLVVTANPYDERLYKTAVEFNDVNWIDPNVVETPRSGGASRKCTGRIRYREPLVECTVESIGNDSYRARFVKSQRAVAAGQSAVFYDGEVCLGGGIII